MLSSSSTLFFFLCPFPFIFLKILFVHIIIGNSLVVWLNCIQVIRLWDCFPETFLYYCFKKIIIKKPQQLALIKKNVKLKKKNGSVVQRTLIFPEPWLLKIILLLSGRADMSFELSLTPESGLLNKNLWNLQFYK